MSKKLQADIEFRNAIRVVKIRLQQPYSNVVIIWNK